MGHSPWGHQESDMTERLTSNTYLRLRSYIISESTAEVWIGFLDVLCIIFSPVLSAVYVPVCFGLFFLT